jgi:hypothetical protein
MPELAILGNIASVILCFFLCVANSDEGNPKWAFAFAMLGLTNFCCIFLNLPQALTALGIR